jgi:hypothetical protein
MRPDLADFVGGSGLYTSLPVGRDGQIINYLADATNGVAWRLRYRAASTSLYKWELIGGSGLYAAVETNETIGAAPGWFNLTTVGPDITLPLAGDYDVEFGCQLTSVQNQSSALMGIAYGTAWGTHIYATNMQVNVASGTIVNVARSGRLTGAAAAALLRARYYSAGGAHQWSSRYLRVLPVRVG